ITDTNGIASVTLPLTLPTGAATLTISYAGTATQTAVTSTQPVTVQPNNNVAPGVNASTLYTGSRFFWTTSPTSSTATLTLTATIQDTTPCAANVDITKAKVSFAVSTNDGSSWSTINNAQNLPVGLVDPANHALG